LATPSEIRRTLENHLTEEIKRSGYPLEIEVSSLLDKDYIVFNTQYYFDEDIKQGRDIDIYAIPFLNVDDIADDKLAPLGLRTEIAIECKKSETHAWVFYTRPLIPPVSRLYIGGQFSDTIPKPKAGVSNLEALLFEKPILHYDKFGKAAIAYDEIKKARINSAESRTPKSRREIFEGVNQLVKFICYEIGPSEEVSVEPKYFSILMLFPIIVFDGDLFEVTFESGEPKPERRMHLLFNTHYRSPYSKKVQSYLVDIVHRTYFNDYLEILKSDFIQIRRCIINNHGEFVKRAKEASERAFEEKKHMPTFAETK